MPSNKAYDSGDHVPVSSINENDSQNNNHDRPQRHIETISSPAILDENTLLSGNGIQTYFSDEKILIPDIEKVRNSYFYWYFLCTVCEYN